MNRIILLRISVIIISLLLHVSIFFLSFRVEEPDEIEKLIPIFQMVDAIVLEEPEEIQVLPPPIPEPEIVEEVNDAVIPDETIEEDPQEPEPAEPESAISSEVDSSISNDSPVQRTETAYIPFYKVEKRPEFISRAELEYPPNAKRNRVEGTVIVEADIDSDGLIQRIKIVKAAGFGFDEAAAAMLENSTFSPAVMDGRQVGVRMRFTIKFEM